MTERLPKRKCTLPEMHYSLCGVKELLRHAKENLMKAPEILPLPNESLQAAWGIHIKLRTTVPSRLNRYAASRNPSADATEDV